MANFTLETLTSCSRQVCLAKMTDNFRRKWLSCATDAVVLDICALEMTHFCMFLKKNVFSFLLTRPMSAGAAWRGTSTSGWARRPLRTSPAPPPSSRSSSTTLWAGFPCSTERSKITSRRSFKVTSEKVTFLLSCGTKYINVLTTLFARVRFLRNILIHNV